MPRRLEGEAPRVTPEVPGVERSISREQQNQGAVRVRTVQAWHDVAAEGATARRNLFGITPEQTARQTAEVEAMIAEFVAEKFSVDSEGDLIIDDQPPVVEEAVVPGTDEGGEDTVPNF